jgi:hypothetical protein
MSKHITKSLAEQLIDLQPKVNGEAAMSRQKLYNAAKAMELLAENGTFTADSGPALKSLKDLLTLKRMIKIVRDAQENQGKYPPDAISAIQTYLLTGVAWNPANTEEMLHGSAATNQDEPSFDDYISAQTKAQHDHLLKLFFAPLKDIKFELSISDQLEPIVRVIKSRTKDFMKPTTDSRFDQSALQPNYFSHQVLPNSADLAFIKSIVKLLRKSGAVAVSQTQALNEIATRLGHKHFGSLSNAVPSTLESIDQRSDRLMRTFAWTLNALSAHAGARELIQNEGEAQRLFDLAAITPVFHYDFSKDARFEGNTISIYPNGALADKDINIIRWHDASKLNLLAIDYEVSAADLVDYFPNSKEQILSLPESKQRALYQATYMNSTHENHPIGDDLDHGFWAHEAVVNYPGREFVCWFNSKHLDPICGSDKIMMRFPEYSYSDALSTCNHIVKDGEALYSNCEPLHLEHLNPSRADYEVRREARDWAIGLNMSQARDIRNSN